AGTTRSNRLTRSGGAGFQAVWSLPGSAYRPTTPSSRCDTRPTPLDPEFSCVQSCRPPRSADAAGRRANPRPGRGRLRLVLVLLARRLWRRWLRHRRVPGTPRRGARVDRRAAAPPGSPVLEIGCGAGFLTVALAA